MAPDRASSGGSIRAQLKVARQQRLHATLIHDDHYQIYGLTADLQSETATAHFKECRSAPSVRTAAGGHAASVFAAEDKTAFEQRWNDGYAFRRAHDLFRNAFIRRGHDLIQHGARLAHSADNFFAIFIGKAGCH